MQNATIQQRVASELKQEFYSPYQLAGVLAKLRGRSVKPQMLYNYVGKKYIAASRNSTGKWQIAKAEAERFLIKQLTPKSESVEAK